jgi:hypothetical protein
MKEETYINANEIKRISWAVKKEKRCKQKDFVIYSIK